MMNQKLNCIMLIDDDRSTNFLNEMVIDELGCAEKIVPVQSGEDALELLVQKDTEDQCYPELIFLDINMPGMDGWEFIEAYRDLGAVAERKTCVVMLTSSLNPKDQERAMNIQEICDYRHKPVTLEMIQDILKQNFDA